MKKQHTGLLIVTLIALFIIAGVVMVLLGASGRLSVIGEEGYTPLDPLLASGTYNKNAFIDTAGTTCRQKYGSSDQVCVRPYEQVSVTANTLWANPTPGAKDIDHPISTRNLRLEDTRFTFVVQNNNDPKYGGKATLSTNRNGALLTLGRETGQCCRNQQTTAGIELRWDDYDLGHYQIFINGAGTPAAQGTVPEGEEFYFTITPKSTYGNDFETAAAGFQNPRTKGLFDCDPRTGEVLASASFIGPETLTYRDLPGLKRFCVTIPAVNFQNGVVGSSKQVYYHLAHAERLTLADGQALKVFYLADASALGVTTSCPSAFLTNTRTCTSMTGIVDICPKTAEFKNGKCVIKLANVIDHNTSIVINSNTEVLVNAHDKHEAAFGGLFVSERPKYTCQGNDGYSTTEEYFRYPDPRASCYVFRVNGHDFTNTQTLDLQGFFTVKVKSAAMNLCYCTNDIGRRVDGGITSDADWNVLYTLTLKKPLVAITETSLQGSVNRGSAHTLTLTNQFGSAYDVTITIIEQSVLTGEQTTQRVNARLNPGKNTIKFTTDSPSVGEHTLTPRVFLTSGTDSLLISDTKTFTYTTLQNTTTTNYSFGGRPLPDFIGKFLPAKNSTPVEETPTETPTEETTGTNTTDTPMHDLEDNTPTDGATAQSNGYFHNLWERIVNWWRNRT